MSETNDHHSEEHAPPFFERWADNAVDAVLPSVLAKIGPFREGVKSAVLLSMFVVPSVPFTGAMIWETNNAIADWHQEHRTHEAAQPQGEDEHSIDQH